METTFLIGNGFDLNLGLETKYEHFYPHYTSHAEFPTKDPDITLFKKLLLKDGAYARWADFERALGKHTDTPPLDQVDSLRKCLEDFIACFSAYLETQQSIIDYEKCAFTMAQRFAASLSSHLNYLEPRPAAAAQAALPMGPTTYHILNFNYTTILDSISELVRREFRGTMNSLGQVIHVHGTLSAGMILGVDNIQQVSNSRLLVTPRQQRLLLKPLLNQLSGHGHDQEALSCIEHSDEVCVFGMSFGETDLIWWQRIGDWLSAASYRQLLIFSHSKDLNPLFSSKILDLQDDIRDLFFSRAGIPAEEQAALAGRVHVSVNSGIFDLDPVMKVPSGGTPAPA